VPLSDTSLTTYELDAADEQVSDPPELQSELKSSIEELHQQNVVTKNKQKKVQTQAR